MADDGFRDKPLGAALLKKSRLDGTVFRVTTVIAAGLARSYKCWSEVGSVMEARIKVTCAGCEKPFDVPSVDQGGIVECPNCGGWVDVPELGARTSTAEMDKAVAHRNFLEYKRQEAEAARLLTESARRIEQAQRDLDLWEARRDSRGRWLDALEAVIDRWERLASRMGPVVDQLGASDAQRGAGPGQGGVQSFPVA